MSEIDTRRMRVLFLCTHNSARSQMAEGFLRALGDDHYEVFSAGTQARGVNPLATAPSHCKSFLASRGPSGDGLRRRCRGMSVLPWREASRALEFSRPQRRQRVRGAATGRVPAGARRD